MNPILWIAAEIATPCRHEINMSSYLTVTANDFFLFKSSEEKGV